MIAKALVPLAAIVWLPVRRQALDGSDFNVGLATVVERLRLAGGDVEIGSSTEIRKTLPAEPRVQAVAAKPWSHRPSQ